MNNLCGDDAPAALLAMPYSASIFYGVSNLQACAFTCASGDDPVQCGALGDLYAATNGATWSNDDGWSAAAAGTPTSYCQFYSVTCEGQAVTSVCVVGAALCAHS